MGVAVAAAVLKMNLVKYNLAPDLLKRQRQISLDNLGLRVEQI